MGEKEIVWLKAEIKTPPFSNEARIECGYLLRLIQIGVSLSLPHSRPMPIIGSRCHELRIQDAQKTWRIIFRIDVDAIIIADVFEKKTTKTPQQVIETCKRRLAAYDREA